MDAKINVGDVLEIAAYRTAHHIPKLDYFEVDSCFVMNDQRMVNALLKMSRVVVGFEGATFDPHTGRFGRRYIYTQPFPIPINYRSGNDNQWNYKKR